MRQKGDSCLLFEITRKMAFNPPCFYEGSIYQMSFGIT